MTWTAASIALPEIILCAGFCYVRINSDEATHTHSSSAEDCCSSTVFRRMEKWFHRRIRWSIVDTTSTPRTSEHLTQGFFDCLWQVHCLLILSMNVFDFLEESDSICLKHLWYPLFFRNILIVLPYLRWKSLCGRTLTFTCTILFLSLVWWFTVLWYCMDLSVYGIKWN